MDLKEVAVQSVNSRHPWELARIEVVASKIRGIIPLIDKEKIFVLDIGCGDTYVIEELSKKFPQLHFLALDINFTSVQLEWFKEKYENTRISVYNSMEMMEESLENPEIDITLMLDVLEHIEQDKDFLEDLTQRIFFTANTFMLITVPAFQTLFCNHDVFLEHFRRYTNQSLIATVKTAALAPVQVGYFFTSLLIARFISVKLLPSSQKDVEPDKSELVDWQAGKFITSMVKNVLLIDYHLLNLLLKLGIKVPGLSNFIICKKESV